ncbi:MAG: hypothetical protein V1722_04215 [Candidatus Micrarchaeota archaeon]
MDFVNEVVEINKFGFTWIKDKQILSLYPLLAALYFIVSLINPTGLAQLFTFQATGIMVAFAAVFVIVVAYVALQYASMKIMRDVLAVNGKNVKPFTPMVFIHLIILSIAFILSALFSVFELKWLVLLIVGILFAVGSYFSMSTLPVSIVFGIIAGVCLAAYLVIMVRNLVRLSFSPYVYLQGASLVGAMRGSWNLTCKKALKIFIILLACAIVTGIISMVFALPQMLAMIGDSLINLAGIPIQPLSALLVAIYSPAVFFISTFVSIKAYVWALGQTKANTTVAPVVKVAAKSAVSSVSKIKARQK